MAFRLIEVWVDGSSAMLQNKATEEALRGTGPARQNTPGAEDDPRTIAERVVYRMPNDHQLGMPGTYVSRALREAAGSHKAKGSRKSLKYILPAAVLVMEDLCPLFLNDHRTPIVDYEVDARPVTIPATRGRVMRYRPRINEWSVKFTLRLNEDILDERLLRTITHEALQTQGFGDYRPSSGGPFGMSTVVSWETVSAPRPATVAQIRNGRSRRAG